MKLSKFVGVAVVVATALSAFCGGKDMYGNDISTSTKLEIVDGGKTTLGDINNLTTNSLSQVLTEGNVDYAHTLYAKDVFDATGKQLSKTASSNDLWKATDLTRYSLNYSDVLDAASEYANFIDVETYSTNFTRWVDQYYSYYGVGYLKNTKYDSVGQLSYDRTPYMCVKYKNNPSWGGGDGQSWVPWEEGVYCYVDYSYYTTPWTYQWTYQEWSEEEQRYITVTNSYTYNITVDTYTYYHDQKEYQLELWDDGYATNYYTVRTMELWEWDYMNCDAKIKKNPILERIKTLQATDTTLQTAINNRYTKSETQSQILSQVAGYAGTSSSAWKPATDKLIRVGNRSTYFAPVAMDGTLSAITGTTTFTESSYKYQTVGTNNYISEVYLLEDLWCDDAAQCHVSGRIYELRGSGLAYDYIFYKSNFPHYIDREDPTRPESVTNELLATEYYTYGNIPTSYVCKAVFTTYPDSQKLQSEDNNYIYEFSILSPWDGVDMVHCGHQFGDCIGLPKSMTFENSVDYAPSITSTNRLITSAGVALAINRQTYALQDMMNNMVSIGLKQNGLADGTNITLAAETTVSVPCGISRYALNASTTATAIDVNLSQKSTAYFYVTEALANQIQITLNGETSATAIKVAGSMIQSSALSVPTRTITLPAGTSSFYVKVEYDPTLHFAVVNGTFD